jgi:HK97 family phage prohead protease
MNHVLKPTGDRERRFFQCGGLEVRAATGEPTRLVGYAAVFDELSENLGGFREKIAPGAFSKSLGGDVRALFNHDPNIIMGRTVAKTLFLSEDQRGLRVEILPPDTTWARDVIASIERGDVDQMSFGFRTKKDDWEENPKQELIRTLIEVDIFDVSPVVFPAYPQTDIAVRSMTAWQEAHKPALPDFTAERRRLDLLALE